ncbi:MAG: glycosyltransferase [Hydrogenovibrio sp.]|uniref:glycosyltransferase n=1 Tax=Hydrogenovibrio sp. TaxID=2065821 RepID=UPI00287024BE|nr:glycosyltransferase [Hydrogenovibrio sp.]MDR9498548.1 glycosyltransferase [Hydrogenovibrio sp.]MDR9499222.1 glycosyltransferase [Hydrogenovibrio sp.]
MSDCFKYRIGLLLGSLSGAGAEKTVLTLAEQLAEIGHEVTLFVLDAKQPDYTLPKNVSLHSCDQLRTAEALSHEVRKCNRFDLFILSRAEFYSTGLADKVVCSVHITPTAWLKKRPFWLGWKTWLQTKKLKSKFFNKELIALSEGIKQDLVQNLGCNESQIQVIPNPFDFKKIRDKVLDSSQIPIPRKPYIIYVAALIPRKRHDYLLRAFALLKNKDVNLVLVGKGPEKRRLEALIHDLGIDNRVFFVPWTNNPYALLYHASLSVLPSKAEGMPRVLIESLILGTKVVASDCPSGPNEVLKGELAKYLVDLHAPLKEFAETMHSALEDENFPVSDLTKFEAQSVAKRYLALVENE